MLGIINFTHSDHLYAAYGDKSIVMRETPKNILKYILQGKLDCGMVSLFEFLENQGRLELVESATIHSLRGTMSTLLVTRKATISSPMKIAVTERTRTTAVYLELVLKKMKVDYRLIWSREREAEALLEEADYALVIGDEALKVYSTNMKIIWDLGYQFSALYSFLPVFSVTVKSKGKDCSREIELLNQAVGDSSEYIDQIVEEDSRRLGLPVGTMRLYFKTILLDFNNEVKKTVDFLSRYHAQNFSGKP